MSDSNSERPKLVLRRTQSVPPIVPTDRARPGERLRGIASPEDLRAIRERYASDVEARYLRGEEPRVKDNLYIESDRTWVSQLNALSGREDRLYTCVVASFSNAIRRLGIYDETRDSEAQMIAEVRDLFEPAGVQTQAALARLIANRSDRGVQMAVANFPQAVEALLDGKPVVHGNQNHMVFLHRISSGPVEEGSNTRTLGVHKVDPFKPVVRSEFTPLKNLAKEESFYRVITVTPPSASRSKLVLR